jgi:hypothetical protein
VLSPEDLARSIVEQVGMLEQYRVPGAMLAVLDDVELYHRDEGLRADAELAGVNSDRNFVLSGDPVGVARVERRPRNCACCTSGCRSTTRSTPRGWTRSPSRT